LPHRAFAHKSEKTTGCDLFAGLPCCFANLHAKIFRGVDLFFKGTQEGFAVRYALCHLTGQLFFMIFSRSSSADGGGLKLSQRFVGKRNLALAGGADTGQCG
jgi:hypothetical protein